MRNIADVIDKIIPLIHEDYLSKEALIYNLEQIKKDSAYVAPEHSTEIWKTLIMLLADMLGRADMKWKKDISAVMAGKEDEGERCGVA